MNYVWILMCSYALVFLAFLEREVRRAQSRRVDREVIRESRRMLGWTILAFLWGTFFTGSIVGALAAGGYWIIAGLIA